MKLKVTITFDIEVTQKELHSLYLADTIEQAADGLREDLEEGNIEIGILLDNNIWEVAVVGTQE